MLLVLDTCEHLIEACSTLVEALRSYPELDQQGDSPSS
jgi:predicted ATPase